MIMGGAAFGVYHGLYRLLSVNVVCLAAALLVAVVLYFILVIKMGAVGARDLMALPQGRAIFSYASWPRRCRLIPVFLKKM